MKKFLTVRLSPEDKKLGSFLKVTKKELDIFFNSSVPEPTIFLLNSRKELDLIWGQKTEQWVVGGTKYGSIFILDPKIYTKESSHSNQDDFWKTMKHEYCHIYFRYITDGVRPLWLHEGLASYLANQNKVCHDPLDVFSYFDKSGRQLYEVGYFWIELLIKKFGKAKLIKLVKALKEKPNLTEKIFATRFYKVYGFKFNKTNLAKIIK